MNFFFSLEKPWNSEEKASVATSLSLPLLLLFVSNGNESRRGVSCDGSLPRRCARRCYGGQRTTGANIHAQRVAGVNYRLPRRIERGAVSIVKAIDWPRLLSPSLAMRWRWGGGSGGGGGSRPPPATADGGFCWILRGMLELDSYFFFSSSSSSSSSFSLTYFKFLESLDFFQFMWFIYWWIYVMDSVRFLPRFFDMNQNGFF